jgi:divalent metal cation (Fe/Co/Zn/Cd) transporter
MDTIAPAKAESAASDACGSACHAPGCGAGEPRPTPGADRPALIREAFRLEWLTVAWMAIEVAVAVSAGLAAGSILLLAFGLDSVIELASACVLIWRLAVELRHGDAFPEAVERLASRIGGALLFALAAYVVATAGWSLWTRQGAEFSASGLVLCLLAFPIMRYLASRKLDVAASLGSRALRADAVESITCGWLSLVVVLGLAAQLIMDAWWIDPLASLAIVWFLLREAREAWNAEECGCAEEA